MYLPNHRQDRSENLNGFKFLALYSCSEGQCWLLSRT